jgi:hypothetical protein
MYHKILVIAFIKNDVKHYNLTRLFRNEVFRINASLVVRINFVTFITCYLHKINLRITDISSTSHAYFILETNKWIQIKHGRLILRSTINIKFVSLCFTN